jgi:hypothetical protein
LRSLAGVEGVQDPQDTKPLQRLTGQSGKIESKREFPKKSNQPSERHLSIFDGRDRIGMVVERNGSVDAFDVNGVHLGTFKKIKPAVSAVNSSLPCSCVCDTNARRDGSE